MPVFVHLAPAPLIARILRNGIRRSRAQGALPAGVFAMPVGPSFFASHQWLREMKRSGQRTISAVYFRVADDEPVWTGHFEQGHTRMTAAEAAGFVSAAGSAEGFEVVIPRRVEASEILRVKPVAQVVGWRYFPGAHGRPPCGCLGCLEKGEIKSSAIRRRYEGEG
jgi:hypothetical protein